MKTKIAMLILTACSLVTIFLQNTNQHESVIPASSDSSVSISRPDTQVAPMVIDTLPQVEAGVAEVIDAVIIPKEEPLLSQIDAAPVAALPDWRYGAMIAHQQVVDGYVDGLLYLVSEIEVSQDEDIRMALAEILSQWNNPEYIEMIIDFGATTQDDIVRVALMRATANMLNGEELSHLLPEYTNTASAEFREFVDDAVWMIDHPNANRWLLDFVDRAHDDKTIPLAERALSVLASQGNTRLMNNVIDIARASGHPLHEGALNALRNTSAERLFATMMREAEGAGGEATLASREAAIRSLRLFDPAQALPSLKSLRSRETNAVVLNAITETIHEIEHQEG